MEGILKDLCHLLSENPEEFFDEADYWSWQEEVQTKFSELKEFSSAAEK